MESPKGKTMALFKYLNGTSKGECVLHYTRRKNGGQRVAQFFYLIEREVSAQYSMGFSNNKSF